MKLLVIGQNYYPELTGIGKYTAEFCSFMAEQEICSVSAITGYPYYPQWKLFEGYRNRRFTKEKISEVEVFRVPLYVPKKPNGLKRLIMDALFILNAFFVVNYLLLFRRQKFDYIFTPVPCFALGLLGLYYRFFVPKTKVLYHIQDLQVDAAANLGIISNKLLFRVLLGIERFIIEHVNQVSTISEGMRDKVMAKSKRLKQCVLFPNWINNKNIYPIDPQPIMSKDGLHDKYIVFYSGAIGEKQGLEIIIETARHFSTFQNNFAFVIAGEGPYKEHLIAASESYGLRNVFFYNLLPVDMFNKMLNAAFVHLVIQKESGSDLFLPSKLTNILGIGGCVIVTASEGTSLHSILYNHKCGYLINPGNVPELCNAIRTLDLDAALRGHLSAKALAYSRKFLNQDSVIGDYLESVGLLTAIPEVSRRSVTATADAHQPDAHQQVNARYQTNS
jgi:colanic acid biosynthesis glycosyl transferase WcaI